MGAQVKLRLPPPVAITIVGPSRTFDSLVSGLVQDFQKDYPGDETDLSQSGARMTAGSNPSSDVAFTNPLVPVRLVIQN
jgi:hypothetical protein